MNALREAAQQALEALKHIWNTTPDDDPVVDGAIASLEAALAGPETCTWWQDGDSDSSEG